MYKLYINGNVDVLIDISYNLEDIMNTLEYFIEIYHFKYKITECDEHEEKTIATINHIGDYIIFKNSIKNKMLKLEK